MVSSMGPKRTRCNPWKVTMIKGVLIDLSGTIHVGGRVLPGAVAAVQRLQREGIPFRFVTNTSRKTRQMIHEDMLGFGFSVPIDAIYSAPRAVRRYVEQHALRPYLLVHPNLLSEFAGLSQDNPNAVVVGFAQHAFTYAAMNRAFQLLQNGVPLLATGKTRYLQGESGLELDAGPFITALEYASGTPALVLGKPSSSFFLGAVSELGCRPEETVMIGDDAASDVGGAIAAGLSAILVQTGKYRPGDEGRIDCHEGAAVAPDIGKAVAQLLVY